METMQATLNEKKFLKQNVNQILIDNAIKKNNVKQFVGQNIAIKDASLLNDQSNLPEKGQLHSLSSHLMNLKSSCSQLKKDIALKQHSTYKFKNQTNFKQQKAKGIKSNRQELEQKIEALAKNLQQVNSKRENITLGVKSYEHILERMKKDDIKFQLRKNDLKRQQKLLQKELNQIEKKYYSVKEFQQMTIHGLNDATIRHCQQNAQRRNQIEAMSRVVLEKQDTNLRKVAREQQTFMIQQMAAGDLQDAQLIKLKKFLTVQQFLRMMLKSKVQKLKQVFQPYEYAFFRIKSSTTARCAQSMKSQFFGFQENYTQKTNWVKHLQQETQQTQKRYKQLKQKLQDLKNEQLELLQQFGSGQSQQKDQTLIELSKKSFASELLMMKLKNWTHFNVQKYQLDNISHQKSTPEEIFKALCEKIKQNFQSIQQRSKQPSNQEITNNQNEQHNQEANKDEDQENIENTQQNEQYKQEQDKQIEIKNEQ